MIGLSDPLWDLVQDCWNEDRSRRPLMQDVEIRVGNAVARRETPMLSRRLVPFPRRPWESFSSLASSSPSSRNSNASDFPRLNAPDIRIVVVEPEDSNPHRIQESYPTSSPITPHPGTQTNEASIDHLDRVSPRMVRFGIVLIPGLAFRTRFCR